MKKPAPHDPEYEYEEVRHLTMKKAILESIIPPFKGEWDGICSLLPYQQAAWIEMTKSEEFMKAKNRREQIGIAMQTLNIKRNGKLLFSHQTIASMFNISRSTLEEQYNKFIFGVKNLGAPSILTIEEQTHLHDWLEEKIKRNDFPSYSRISHHLQKHFHKEISQNTLSKFISTHFTDFKFVLAHPIEDIRFDVDGNDIDKYYHILESHIKKCDFRFFFNLDETGEDEYVDTSAIHVCVHANDKPGNAKVPVSRRQKRFSIIHTICADGSYFNMFIVIPRMTIESDIYKIYDPLHIFIGHQNKGFVNIKAFTAFWNNCFIPQLREKRLKYRYTGLAILIMDNHKAHRNVLKAHENEQTTFIADDNLLVIWLIPHSSDQTQPLDLGIFGVHKLKKQRIMKDKHETVQASMINQAVNSLEIASTTNNVVKAFKAAGITREVTIDKETNKVKIVLIIDKKSARAVRHWNTDENDNSSVSSDSDVDQANHFPEFPRIDVQNFD